MDPSAEQAPAQHGLRQWVHGNGGEQPRFSGENVQADGCSVGEPSGRLPEERWNKEGIKVDLP